MKKRNKIGAKIKMAPQVKEALVLSFSIWNHLDLHLSAKKWDAKMVNINPGPVLIGCRGPWKWGQVEKILFEKKKKRRKKNEGPKKKGRKRSKNLSSKKPGRKENLSIKKWHISKEISTLHFVPAINNDVIVRTMTSGPFLRRGKR